MPDTQATTADQAAPLSELLLTHAKGSVDAEAGAALRELVSAVAATVGEIVDAGRPVLFGAP